jgi:glycosyltransferase involved in cell wall biosynthesis
VFARASGATVRNRAAETLLRTQGFAGPVELFPHAVDLARYENRSTAMADGLTRPVFGFVGRLVTEKGVAVLIDAVARAQTGSLLIVGDGPERDALEKRAAAAGIEARFVGAIEHDAAPDAYAAMDVVAVPSLTTAGWKEQFGRIVIEANAGGVPVVTSDSGELPATVEATGGGVVVPEGDAAALGEALARLGGDAAARRSLGEEGRRGVAARFTPEAVASRLLVFFESVIERWRA